VRQEIDERSPGSADAVRQQRRVPPVMATEMVDQQVWRGDDRSDEPDDERRHQERHDDHDDEDRQRRTHKESEEHHAHHLDGAERLAGCQDCERGVLLERLAR
jgi:hypothetical protein